MSSQARVIELVREQGFELPAGVTLERTYAGRHQRAAGAWTWQAYEATGAPVNLGSKYTLGQLAPGLTLIKDTHGDTHAFPNSLVGSA